MIKRKRERKIYWKREERGALGGRGGRKEKEWKGET